jgi:hypothetical protein
MTANDAAASSRLEQATEPLNDGLDQSIHAHQDAATFIEPEEAR